MLLRLLLIITLGCGIWLDAGTVQAAVGHASSGSAASSGGRMLRVGLVLRTMSINISSSGSYVVRDAETGKGLGKFGADALVSLRVSKQQLLLNGKPIAAKSLEVVPQDQQAFVKLGSKRYRGRLLVLLRSGGITVVNQLPLEEYLYGVLPSEMPADWPAEALKAQAVAARTFAIHNIGRHAEAGFDLCATTHCQVYDGMTGESPATSAAVDATNGQVLYYAGKPIYAAFHTSSGGMTENSEDVWGNYVPYLRAVHDDDQASPSHHWNVKFTAPEVQIKLVSAGYDIGVLQKIELTPLHLGAGRTADRSATGRVQTLRFMGTKKTVILTGDEVRKAFSLKSTLFDIRIEKPNIQSIEVDNGLDTKKLPVDLPDIEEKNYGAEKMHVLHNKNGETVVFDGYGWGHGLGMSQWGARSMALKADYRAILAHYYSNTEIKKIY